MRDNMTDEPVRCTKCRENLPISQFAADRSKALGRRSWCKPCEQEKSRRYYAEHRSRVIARVSAQQKAKTQRASF
jgi:hypothetical protein